MSDFIRDEFSVEGESFLFCLLLSTTPSTLHNLRSGHVLSWRPGGGKGGSKKAMAALPAVTTPAIVHLLGTPKAP